MSGFQGVDMEAASATAGLMRAYAAALEVQVRELTKALLDTAWTGPDADRFREDWDGAFAVGLDDVIEELRRHAKVLADRADRQARVSH